MYLYIIGTVRVPQNIELNRPDCLLHRALGCLVELGGAWWSLVELGGAVNWSGSGHSIAVNLVALQTPVS